MNDDDSDSKQANDRRGLAAGHGDRRREPVFTDFDEDEDYEESERDTDYTSTYEEEVDDDEDLEPLEDEDPEILSTEWQVLAGRPGAVDRPRDTHVNPWAVEDSVDTADDDAGEDATEFARESEPELFDDEDEYPEDDDLEEDWDELESHPEGSYPEESDDLETQAEEMAHSWPLGLVIVGLVALVLLAAGGYGVIQQRSAAQQEIRQLQATLATAASPAEVAAGREALRELERRNVENEAAIETLTLENRRLENIVAGLEAQLSAQQTRAADPKPAAASPSATKAPPAAKTVPSPTGQAAGASAAPGGRWFVNFSSYSQRSVADSWVKKLNPSVGRAVVVPGSKDGATFYRVRIIGLADRAQAEQVASRLQSAHHLPPLWVGRE